MSNRLLALLPLALWGCGFCRPDTFCSGPLPPEARGVNIVNGGCDSQTWCRVVWSASGTGALAYTVADRGGTPWLFAIYGGSASQLLPIPALTYLAYASDTVVYYVGPAGMTAISVTSGVSTVLSSHTGPVSPDGRLMLFHAPGTGTTDTLIALDLASGTRRATRVGTSMSAFAFSSDGTQVVLAPNASSANQMVIWHLDTGVQEAGGNFAGYTALLSVAWSRGAFRALVGLPVATNVALREVLVSGGGAAVDYNYLGTSPINAIAWVPDRSSAFDSSVGPNRDYDGEENNVVTWQYDLRYITASALDTVGTVNTPPSTDCHGSCGNPATQLSASPDGHWLLYVADKSLYLVTNPSP